MENEIDPKKPHTICVGKASITLFPDGLIRIKGIRIEMESKGPMILNGSTIDLN